MIAYALVLSILTYHPETGNHVDNLQIDTFATLDECAPMVKAYPKRQVQMPNGLQIAEYAHCEGIVTGSLLESN